MIRGCGENSENQADVLSFEGGPLRTAAKKMNLVVQGKQLSYIGPPDVRSLLESQGENSLYANVRINGTILSRRDFENIPLQDGDSIDFLYFMGGGSCST